MTWPTQQTKEHADQGTDDPKQWRAEVAAFVDRFNQLRNHVTSFMQTFLSRSTAAAARSDLGALHDNVSATDRFLGRRSAGAGPVEELTGAQATARLNAFTSILKGLAPASGGGTDNFLRADATWAPATPTVFESAEISISTGSSSNHAHGFSSQPKLAWIVMRCKSADLNYSVGDEVKVGFAMGQNPDGVWREYGVDAVSDGTNITVIQGETFNRLPDKSTGVAQVFTTSNWRLVVYAMDM